MDECINYFCNKLNMTLLMKYENKYYFILHKR